MEQLFTAATPQGMRMMQAQGFPDYWAQMIDMKVDGHPFSFDGRMYLKDIIRDHSSQRVIRKSAQMGATVISLTTALFWWIQWRWNTMYLLPVKAGTVSFSQGRVEPMIDSTEWIAKHLESVDNINHKRTEHANFYVRGTNIQTELQEVPIDAMIWDELDKMKQANLPLARTRMDASKHKWVMMLSTPTVPGYGVDAEFRDSDKRHWYIKCPMCGHQQTLTWDDNVKIGDSHRDTIVACSGCNKEMSHDKIITASDEGEWIQHSADRAPDAHGYQINQLFSPTRKIDELAKIYFRGLERPDAMKELYNSALGLPYVTEGEQLTEEILDNSIEPGHKLWTAQHNFAGHRVNVGVDVGKVLHVQASTIDPTTGKRVKRVMQIMDWNELKMFLSNLTDFVCVIDNFPETSKATELARMFWGRVFLCFYNDKPEALEWDYPVSEADHGQVKANRTLAIDLNISQYVRGQVVLPGNAREIGELRPSLDYNGFYDQMTSMIRMEKPDRLGNMKPRYEQIGSADHWHHADVYETIASQFMTPGVPPVAQQQAKQYDLDDLGMGDLETYGDDLLLGEGEFDVDNLGFE